MKHTGRIGLRNVARSRVRDWLVQQAEPIRIAVNGALDPVARREYAQFMTPVPVACLMASMFGDMSEEVCILDAGAGIGALSAAFVAGVPDREERPQRISVTAYEIDPLLASRLETVLGFCREACEECGIEFVGDIRQEDFVAVAVEQLSGTLMQGQPERYNYAIMTPYKKIRSASHTRRYLRRVGIEVSNIYAGFIALVTKLLHQDGEFVFISPRSFCNGPYFPRFRKDFLRQMALRRIHVFESRTSAFREGDVLQENVVSALEDLSLTDTAKVLDPDSDDPYGTSPPSS